MRTDLLTPAEAAVVASVTVRDINLVIDETILPERFYSAEGSSQLRNPGTFLRFTAGNENGRRLTLVIAVVEIQVIHVAFVWRRNHPPIK